MLRLCQGHVQRKINYKIVLYLRLCLIISDYYHYYHYFNWSKLCRYYVNYMHYINYVTHVIVM